MNRLLLFSGILITIALASCSKEESVFTCTGYSADDMPLFIAKGTEVCEEQINVQAGEYCECENE